MGYLFFVAGTGRSGTKWIAELLSDGTHIRCYHELTNEFIHPQDCAYRLSAIRHLSSPKEQLEEINRELGGYFRTLDEEVAEVTALGDSNSALYQAAELVAAARPTASWVLLVRNGILTVNSAHRHFIRTYPQDAVSSQLERLLLDCGPVDATEPALRLFAYYCMSWAAQLRFSMRVDAFRSDLGMHPVELRTVRLEDLNRDVSTVQNLARWLAGDAHFALSLEHIRSMQGRAANVKMGIQDARAVWASWTVEERRVFRKLCGETMEHFGYPMPE